MSLRLFFFFFWKRTQNKNSTKTKNKTHTFSLARPACFCTDFAIREPLLSAILPNDSMRLIAHSFDSQSWTITLRNAATASSPALPFAARIFVALILLRRQSHIHTRTDVRVWFRGAYYGFVDGWKCGAYVCVLNNSVSLCMDWWVNVSNWRRWIQAHSHCFRVWVSVQVCAQYWNCSTLTSTQAHMYTCVLLCISIHNTQKQKRDKTPMYPYGHFASTEWRACVWVSLYLCHSFQCAWIFNCTKSTIAANSFVVLKICPMFTMWAVCFVAAFLHPAPLQCAMCVCNKCDVDSFLTWFWESIEHRLCS